MGGGGDGLGAAAKQQKTTKIVQRLSEESSTLFVFVRLLFLVLTCPGEARKYQFTREKQFTRVNRDICLLSR